MTYIKDSPLARPIRDFGLGGLHESVAGVRCRYGLGETWQFALAKDSSVARNGSHRGLGGIDERSWRGRPPPPNETAPKGSSHLAPMCEMPGQLVHLVTLPLQQNRQQPALRKGRV